MDTFTKYCFLLSTVCFDIRTINGEAENYKYETWNIGACSKAISGNTEPGPNNEGYIINVANRPYDYTIQRCCLSPKTYDLTCRDTFEKEMDGWNGGAIEIQGHKYCDDFVEKSVKRKVAIQGKSNLLRPTIFFLFSKYLFINMC